MKIHLLDFFFPKRCVGCGKVGAYFCEQCKSTIRVIADNEAVCPVCERLALDGATHPVCRTEYTPDGLTSFFCYDGVVRKGVKALKYRLVTDLADEFASLIPEWIPGLARNDNMILIPIPLHTSRLKERGFNQAEVLGSLLATKLNIPMHTDILKRVKQTAPQASIKHRKERLKNMEHAFQCNNVSLSHRYVALLFDDVFTTGATMRDAANVLKRAGVKRVWAVTMAR